MPLDKVVQAEVRLILKQLKKLRNKEDGIIWSDIALHQLNEVLDYVEEHFGSSVACKTLDNINTKVERLLLFPESGTPDYSYSSKILNDNVLIRHLNIGPNIVYYNVDGEIINIMVIAHYKQSTATVVKMIKRWVVHKIEL